MQAWKSIGRTLIIPLWMVYQVLGGIIRTLTFTILLCVSAYCLSKYLPNEAFWGVLWTGFIAGIALDVILNRLEAIAHRCQWILDRTDRMEREADRTKWWLAGKIKENNNV